MSGVHTRFVDANPSARVLSTGLLDSLLQWIVAPRVRCSDVWKLRVRDRDVIEKKNVEE